jgi:hypothetical protein
MTEEEEEYVNPNVTVHYNVGPGHELYDADGAEEFAWEELRARRNYLLKRVDVYQGVLVYETLTDTQKDELATYRQALLDWPESSDDPSVVWENRPAKPSWL